MHVDTPQTHCRAGVARGEITPPVGIYHRMWGAATHDRATGVHRPLLATVLWLEPLAGISEMGQLIVALDHCILDNEEVDRLAAAASRAAGIMVPQVYVTTSHTHGAGLMLRSRGDFPGGDLIGPYLDSVAERLTQLAPQAVRSARPATIVYGMGRCSLAAHRDLWDEQSKQFVCGLHPQGPADDSVQVARITADDGATLATIVNYACHPTTLAWDNTAISPDYVGALRETVEHWMASRECERPETPVAHAPGSPAPCLFLQGASGDLGPREGFVGNHAVADRNGRQLAFAALSALEALPPPLTRYVYRGPVISGATIGVWEHVPLDDAGRNRSAAWQVDQWIVNLPYRDDLPTVAALQEEQVRWQGDEARAREQGDMIRARDCRARFERTTRWLARLRTLPAGKSFPLPVAAWRLGNAFWVIVPGEHYQALQTGLRARFPDQAIVVVTLTGGWLPGYVPTRDTYGRGIYQESIAVVAAGSAETLLEEITRRMRTMTDV